MSDNSQDHRGLVSFKICDNRSGHLIRPVEIGSAPLRLNAALPSQNRFGCNYQRLISFFAKGHSYIRTHDEQMYELCPNHTILLYFILKYRLSLHRKFLEQTIRFKCVYFFHSFSFWSLVHCQPNSASPCTKACRRTAKPFRGYAILSSFLSMTRTP